MNRLALQYAVREFRAVGRHLVTAHNLTPARALLVMARALFVVTEFGIESVKDALDDALSDLLGGR